MFSTILSVVYAMFGDNLFTTDGHTQALMLFNPGLMRLCMFSNDAFYRGMGESVYNRINQVIAEIGQEPSTGIQISKDASDFSAFGFYIIPYSRKGTFHTHHLNNLLYYLFDTARSVVPPQLFDEYIKEFEAGRLDICYGLLNSVYGCVYTDELTYLMALRTKEKMVMSQESGVLFVDTQKNKVYKMVTSQNLSHPRVLIVPNGTMNVYKFLTFSLYLIDKMIEDSQYKDLLEKLKSRLFYGINVDVNTNGSKIECVSTTGYTPIVNIVAYKYFVYLVLSLEIFCVPEAAVYEFVNELEKVMFEESCTQYIVKSNSGMIPYLRNILIAKKSENIL